MTLDHHIQNPFDTGRDILKNLQAQVAELQAGLQNEQQERKREAENLRAILSQENSDRTLHLQQMEQLLSQQTNRLDQAQHRIRFDMGDLRAAVAKASQGQQADAQDIRQEMATEVNRLTETLKHLQSDHESQGIRLTNSVETEVRDRTSAMKALVDKLDAEDARLQNAITANAHEFQAYRTALDADHAKTKQTTQHLVSDVDWLASKLRAAALIAESFKQLKWASVSNSAPDVPPGAAPGNAGGTKLAVLVPEGDAKH